jgi:hypothetical protein
MPIGGWNIKVKKIGEGEWEKNIEINIGVDN